MSMLYKLFSAFQDKREVLDFATFKDELAPKTSWSPLIKGGTKFCTYRLHATTSISKDIVEFKATLDAYLFSIFMFTMGIMIFFALSWLGSKISLIALMLAAWAIWYFWDLGRRESAINRSLHIYSKKGKSYDIKDIRAIQLIREIIINKNSYYSYELNLVRSNGGRINIVDHGNLQAIREDALILADFLDIPVWDAIDFRIPEPNAAYGGKTEY